MCNLYSSRRARGEIVALSGAMSDRNGNAPPLPGIYPDYSAPVVVRGADGRELRDMRWGLPSSKKALLDAAKKRADALRQRGKSFDFDELLKMEPDKGTTNVRYTSSAHWKRWLGPDNRCLVPMTSFAEPDQVGGTKKPIWFALDETRPLAFFAGIHTPWACVRKISEGWVDCELFGFLTTEPQAEVAPYHNKASPVILTEPEQWDLWMSDAPWAEVAHLQRPLPPGSLTIVARDVRKDEVELA